MMHVSVCLSVCECAFLLPIQEEEISFYTLHWHTTINMLFEWHKSKSEQNRNESLYIRNYTNCFTYFVSGFCLKCHCVIYFLSLKSTTTIAPKITVISKRMFTVFYCFYVSLLTYIYISLCMCVCESWQIAISIFQFTSHAHPSSFQLNLNEKRNETKRNERICTQRQQRRR